MEERYIFRPAAQQEVATVFALIMRRVAWMDRVGIRQWNTTCYDQRYPLDYYEQRRQMDELFVLEDRAAGRLLCVGALLHEDERWPDPASAYYLHHLASELDAKGAGSLFLQEAERYAAGRGKRYLRLDSAVGNRKLEAYYTSRGYVEAGRCTDGLYEGILRQKALKKVTVGPKPTLISTPHLELRAIGEGDEDAVIDILTHSEVGKTYMVPVFGDREEARKLAQAFCRLSARPDRFVYGVYLEQALIGFVNDVEIAGQSIELGYVISPGYQNRGFATEALTAAIKSLFDMGYEVVKTGAFEENAASIRVMEKCAMTRLEQTEQLEYRGKVHRCVLFEKTCAQS